METKEKFDRAKNFVAQLGGEFYNLNDMPFDPSDLFEVGSSDKYEYPKSNNLGEQVQSLFLNKYEQRQGNFIKITTQWCTEKKEIKVDICCAPNGVYIYFQIPTGLEDGLGINEAHAFVFAK